MAVWTIPKDQIIDYSANGDDVDSFSQKVKFCIEDIFDCLQHLHSNGATAGLDGDATPYEIRVNTADNCIYIRNGDNTAWILLGEVAEHFGLTAEAISAVANGGGMKRLFLGTEIALPTKDNQTFDLYFAQDTSRVFIWTGTMWRKFLSLNFGDMLDYEKYCVAKAEVTSIGGALGAGKILRLDKETGKGNIDITGSPERLCDYLIDVQSLGDGHVLAFNAEKQKFVNLPNYELTKADTTYQGGTESAGKLIQISSDGKIHADITGSANKIDGVNIQAQSVSNGDVLQYDAVSNSFVPAKKDVFTEGDVTTIGEANKLVKVAADGLIHANIEGSASEIANVPVNLSGVQEGHVLIYKQGKFVPAKKDELDDSSTTTTGEADKIVKVGEDGKIHADITGSAQKICLIPVDINNIGDGQILRYHQSTNTFRNEDQVAVGAGKSLVLLDGDKVLGDYNGAQTVNVNLQEVLKHSMLSTEVAHLMRLTENLYLALDAADLNPSGYDRLSGETFYGDTTDIDTTAVNVLSVIVGDDSIDVDSIDGLIEGSHYILSDGVNSLPVQIKHILYENGIFRVIFYNAVTTAFTPALTKLYRTTATIEEGKVSGDDVYCTANLIPFVNEATGEATGISHAHLSVKHQNVADAEITAEIALRDGVKFVKGEVIGIGNGSAQTALLEHTNDLTAYKFALYFDGVQQTDNFEFSPLTGQVTFTAANNVIVSADYFYDWTAETFVEMTKTGTYPDRRDQTRATTQFVYNGAKGSVATIRLKLKRGSGYSSNEIVSSGTGKPRGFKLAHQAISSSTISVSPTPTSKSFNSAQNTVIVTASVGKAIQISYSWKGKAFSVDSFACTFNE